MVNTTSADSRSAGNELNLLGSYLTQQAQASPWGAVNNTAAGGVNNMASAIAGGTSPLSQTPNWQTTQNQVEQTYDQSANLNNAQNINSQQQALAAMMGQSGMTGSTFNQSGQVGLQNLSALLGAQANEQGLTAGLAAGSSLRNEASTDYLNALQGLNTVSNTSLNQTQQPLQTGINAISAGGNAILGQANQEASSNPLGSILGMLGQAGGAYLAAP
jgi:hypothetical protein